MIMTSNSDDILVDVVTLKLRIAMSSTEYSGSFTREARTPDAIIMRRAMRNSGPKVQRRHRQRFLRRDFMSVYSSSRQAFFVCGAIVGRRHLGRFVGGRR
ncbi:unnamed protein product [Ilex paraguariensis]|uniref:Uncharacterized protein n=1 Tax=Ilex paraguariensis TaxID=185542 RepID=A0ABC8U7N5_9AQUA